MMSNPIMIVRKIKSNSKHKLDKLPEHPHKPSSIPSDEQRPNLSKSLGPMQGSIVLNKSRSSSLLKQKLNPGICTNTTPLNKKARNRSYLIGHAIDISEAQVHSKSQPDSRSKNLQVLESWLSDTCKAHSQRQNPSTLFEALRKLPLYDPALKKYIDELCRTFEPTILTPKEENPLTRPSSSLLENLSSQIAELKANNNELLREKNNFRKNVDQMNEILTFMKRKGVPVEQYFQEYFVQSKTKGLKETVSKSVKNLSSNESKVNIAAIPKLSFAPPTGNGFHQEFMAKVEEFSDSWRELIKNEKSST